MRLEGTTEGRKENNNDVEMLHNVKLSVDSAIRIND